MCFQSLISLGRWESLRAIVRREKILGILGTGPIVALAGPNTRAALITRGLAEMKRFVLAYGGTPETLSGLAGTGDLIVTCTSRHSRNHSVGERLGKGEKINDILGSMQMVAEGVWNSKVVHEIARKLGVDMPICDLVYALCYEVFDARKAVEAIMTRDLKSE